MPHVPLSQYLEAARAGHILALPTDTVWGLAVAPDQGAKLYALKQRSLEKSLILMGGSAADLWPYVTLDSIQWQTMTDRYWPGQLTLVVPASPQVPLAMHPHTPETIGVRVPDHPAARQILAKTGPLATTSANLSGKPTLINLEQVLDQFPQVYGFKQDTLEQLIRTTDQSVIMPTPSGQPSTVAHWGEKGWKVLRQGTVYL